MASKTIIECDYQDCDNVRTQGSYEERHWGAITINMGPNGCRTFDLCSTHLSSLTHVFLKNQPPVVVLHSGRREDYQKHLMVFADVAEEHGDDAGAEWARKRAKSMDSANQESEEKF